MVEMESDTMSMKWDLVIANNTTSAFTFAQQTLGIHLKDISPLI